MTDIVDRLRAALAAQPADTENPVSAQPAPAAVPEAKALIPIEPTPEMLDAWSRIWDDTLDSYLAILAAGDKP